MFSVQASPFNSSERQLYGGWTQDQSTDLWSRLAWHRVSAKFNPDAEQRKKSAAYIRDWAAYFKKLSKAQQKELRVSQFQKYRRMFKREPLTRQQRTGIWNLFERTPVPTNAQQYGRYRAIYGATYPPPGLLNQYPDLFYPKTSSGSTYDFDNVPWGDEPYDTWLANFKLRRKHQDVESLKAADDARKAHLSEIFGDVEHPVPF